ncbi:hypothetical protein F9C28_19450 [Shimwellia pseudoproteus]|uniref:radical SAM protein n=1 Tax=Shimwellia pseudoproteus TaxID=570012 RepID=UPI0018EAF784|nr:radical SAM protein [Shimwellia pseudoproteus]MBJ3817001.1 hypothetical protein [Shimwellia pseudoproteus]
MLGRLFTAITPQPYGLFPYRNIDFSRQRPVQVMDSPTLEDYIGRQIASQPEDDVTFDWLCGEPSPEKLAFFRDVVGLQARLGGGRRIHNSVLIDGYLPDDGWVQFLSHHQWLVELPLAGPAEWHDLARTRRGLPPDHAVVMDTLARLKLHQVNTKLLVDVNPVNCQHPRGLYDWLKQTGVPFIQFVPRIEGAASDILNGPQWGHFLTTVFRCWVHHDIGQIFIQQFDAALGAWCGLKPAPGMTPACQRCEMGWLCRAQPSATPDVGCVLCSGYLDFFTYSAPFMRVMRDLIAQRRSPVELIPLLASVRKSAPDER